MPGSLLLLFAAIGVAICNPLFHDQIDSCATERPKRNTPIDGLIPFPRTGRTDPKMAPNLERHPFILSENLLKKDGLFEFPFISRSGPKRNGASGSGGLWFGPRLGRTEKRSQGPIFTSFEPEYSVADENGNQVFKSNSPRIKGGYFPYSLTDFHY